MNVNFANIMGLTPIRVETPVCATPTFDPVAGEYEGEQSVELASATAGATILFTTDGSDPTTENSTTYVLAIPVSETQTIKAVAVKTGCTDSAVASALYTISESAPTGTVAQILQFGMSGFPPSDGDYALFDTIDGDGEQVHNCLWMDMSGTSATPDLGSLRYIRMTMADFADAKTVIEAGCEDEVVVTPGETSSLIENVNMGVCTAPSVKEGCILLLTVTQEGA